MAKKRKTRQDKIIADLRHQLNLSTLPEVQEKKTITETKISLAPVTERTYASQTISYDFLISDLRKTAIITTSFIFLQTVLFFLLKNHIIAIPGLNY